MFMDIGHSVEFEFLYWMLWRVVAELSVLVQMFLGCITHSMKVSGILIFY